MSYKSLTVRLTSLTEMDFLTKSYKFVKHCKTITGRIIMIYDDFLTNLTVFSYPCPYFQTSSKNINK